MFSFEDKSAALNRNVSTNGVKSRRTVEEVEELRKAVEEAHAETVRSIEETTSVAFAAKIATRPGSGVIRGIQQLRQKLVEQAMGCPCPPPCTDVHEEPKTSPPKTPDKATS